ncbi:PHb [Pseudomonas phage phi8]|uniref:PHb n=1 Tax=Pseudomonas phage phi8 TaxID=120086 RepID=Q9MC16_9VIRU|nr:PHb [Pseudomonas phage phi8]AAF63299.2 PHb [Pseudomonas phage phi8]
MSSHAAKARKGLFSALAKDRVTKSISNPTVKAHAHGVAALLMFVAGRLESRYGAPFAINFHAGLFHAGTSSSARLGSLITTMVGVGAVRNAASHWLGGMDYHELAQAALPLYEEARHTTILARVPDIEDVDDELALLMHEIGIRFTDGAITIIEPY